MLAAIIFVATKGCTWRQLSPVFGPSGSTAHRRFTEWGAARAWAKPHRLILDELGSRGDLDWLRRAIDSASMRVLKGGPDRSESCPPGPKKGSEIHLITQRSGLHFSIAVSGANPHEVRNGELLTLARPGKGVAETMPVLRAVALTRPRPDPSPP